MGGAKGLNLSIFSRIKQIAAYRNLSQTEIGSWFDISPAAWGKRERGESRGFPLDELQTFLEKTQIDARWVFGQLEGPIEEADLRSRGPEKALTERLLEEIQELRKRTRPLKELDPLAERVVNDLELRRLVEKLLHRRVHFKRIEGYLEGLEEGLADAREPAETRKEKIGETFIRQGKMTKEDAENVLQVQRDKYSFSRRFGEIAVEMGILNQKALDDYLDGKGLKQ